MEPTRVLIESLDQEGRGVTRVEGKAVFVEGGLPGESVALEIIKHKPSYEIGRVLSVESASASRVIPRCPHFGVCGGCALQHADPALQIAAKQRVLEDALARIGRVEPDFLLPSISGPPWEYRFRARFSVRNVVKKGGVLVGFHERKSSFVSDMRECHVVPRKISELLPALRKLVESLSIRDRLPQIELAVGERLQRQEPPELVYALVLRILEPLAPSDEPRLTAFADAHGVDLWLQPGGPETAAPFHPRNSTLAYTLPEFDLAMPFSPTDFTQVNPYVNRVLVRRAIELLAPAAGERIVDFFCGLGNFTLPIARRGAQVLGIDGSAPLLERARANAARNGLSGLARYATANLFAMNKGAVAAFGRLDRALLDPPRDGAIELVKTLPRSDTPEGLQRIVYVSCSPSTLARDAGVLVHDRGYRLAAAGVVNMFPHTAHVESIALFER